MSFITLGQSFAQLTERKRWVGAGCVRDTRVSAARQLTLLWGGFWGMLSQSFSRCVIMSAWFLQKG